MSTILDDFPRGVHTRDINQHNLPFAAWTDADAILASPALPYATIRAILAANCSWVS